MLLFIFFTFSYSISPANINSAGLFSTMSLFNEDIYMSDYSLRLGVDRIDGKVTWNTSAVDGSVSATHLQLYHSLYQPSGASDPCANSPCKFQCLPRHPSLSPNYKCFCDFESTLDADLKSCTRVKNYLVISQRLMGFRAIPINSTDDVPHEEDTVGIDAVGPVFLRKPPKAASLHPDAPRSKNRYNLMTLYGARNLIYFVDVISHSIVAMPFPSGEQASPSLNNLGNNSL